MGARGIRQNGRVPGEIQQFAYLSAPNASLYRGVMAAFVRAKERFVVHLRPEEVAAELAGEVGEQVPPALEQLVAWGNLRADPDTSRVTTVEDFHRKRFLYQMTREGQAAQEAIAFYDEAVGRRGALQSVALTDIDEQLRALAVLAGEPDPDPAKVHRGLLAIAYRFASLADNAQAFMSSLRRAIDFADGDVAAFLAYKQHLIGYINRFIADLANSGAAIATLLIELDRHDPDRLLLLAARRDAADAAPDGGAPAGRIGGDAADPTAEDGQDGNRADADWTDGDRAGVRTGDGQVDGDGTGGDVAADPTDAVRAGTRAGGDVVPGTGTYDRAVAAALESWRNRWRGLHDWFVSGEHGHPSQARMLRQAAVTAIKQLVDTVALLNERRSGRSDRSADFRTLARWFAEAPNEDAMHRLWRAAFGMTSARHLSVTAQTVTEWEREPPAASTPWRQAPPISISPQLRKTGSYERRGKQHRVRDRSEQRRLLAEQADREAAQTAAARERLVTDGPTLLSELDTLDTRTFRLFLALLGDALAARTPDAADVKTSTADGSLEIRLCQVPGGGEVAIATEDGVLRGPEHVVEITEAGMR